MLGTTVTTLTETSTGSSSMSHAHMAALKLIGTIESDEEIAEYESDADIDDVERNAELTKKKTKKKPPKKDDFEVQFQFSNSEDDQNQCGWNLEETVQDLKKESVIHVPAVSLDLKIGEKRKERKLLKKSGYDNGSQNMDGSKNMVTTCTFESESEDDPDDNESSLCFNSKKVKNDEFFEEGPTQFTDLKFTDMNLSRPIVKAINELQFTSPTPIQSSTIPLALMGKDICASSSTGTGKTAAFVLPILERLLFRPIQVATTRVLILVPTRELAVQVHSVSKALAKFTNIQICLATGGLETKTQEASLRKNPDIIVATPGRLVDFLHNTPSFGLQYIEILVLDEADRMLDENFRDQIEEIVKFSPRGRQTMLFSATMTDEVNELVLLSLNHPVKLFINSNTNVAENLRQEFIRIKQTREQDRTAIVVALCCRSFHENCLLFVQTKQLAHRLRIFLGLLGIKVDELHGNLTQLQRLEALNRFKKGEVDVLVATDLASRGLDVVGVKTVINYSMPNTIKQYIHRVGRTARAGLSGRSISLVGEGERKLLKEIVKQAHNPVKSRVVAHETIAKFREKLEDLADDVQDILKQERDEKELRVTEMEANKARNMIIHQEEILSRPPRVWFQSNSEKKKGKKNGGEGPGAIGSKKRRKVEKLKQMKKLDPEELKARHFQDYLRRDEKRKNKKKRIRAFASESKIVRQDAIAAQMTSQSESGRSASKKRQKAPAKPDSSKTFEKELTDTSRKSLSAFRSFSSSRKNKKNVGKFKSKKRS